MKTLPYFLLPASVLVDVSMIFFEKSAIVPAFRAALFLMLIIMVSIKYISNTKYYLALIGFCIYTLLIALVSNNPLGAMADSTKLLIPILCFIIGFNLINSLERLKRLNKSVVAVYILLIVNFVISNLFGLGESVYTKGADFLNGSLHDGWNLFTYSILIAPLIVTMSKNERGYKILVLIVSFVCAILVFVSLKRIAIVGLAFGFVIIVFFSSNLKQSLRYGMIVLLAGLLTFPFIQDTLSLRVESRAGQLTGENLDKETRVLETIHVWSEALSFKDPVKSWFGLAPLKSTWNFKYEGVGERFLHVDYNIIVNSLGLVGLLFYLYMFYDLYRNFKKHKVPHFLNKNVYKMLVATFYALIICQFMTSLSGQMSHISFRATVFIYLGAIIGIFHRHKRAYAVWLVENREGEKENESLEQIGSN